jgi:proline-specific peptidase
MSYAIKRPKGLKGLVLASTLPSSRLWVQETRKLVAKLPAKHRAAIYKYEKLKKYNHKEYLAANVVFAQKHIRQIPALYDGLQRAKFGKHVYNAMWGPTEFTVTGSLHDWSVEKDLHKINVPALLISGSNDEAAPAMQRFMKSRIKGSEWHCIEGAAHTSYIEAPLEWMNTVNNWLSKKKL